MVNLLSKFLQDYEFYRIREEKGNVLLSYNCKSSKIYTKSKDSFIEEIYNIALTYSKSIICN